MKEMESAVNDGIYFRGIVFFFCLLVCWVVMPENIIATVRPAKKKDYLVST